ncbi:hypothetical protein SAMN05414138_10212 [Rhodoplanes sp. JGI PP 4-B12]|nr:hypothetical protein SAMN05414138_10212 [Rhodoplanes sp. JGI PP 4-B12]
MTDSTNNQPPPHVAAAAKIVDEWLKGQPSIPGAGPPPSTLSAAERFKRAREVDQSKMPPWKDPRAA